MRLGLCSNRTCWAFSTFYTPCAVQNWIFWLRTLCAGHPGFRRFRDSVLPTVFLQHWHVKINLLTCACGWLVKILGQLNLSVTDPHFCFEKDVLIMILTLVNCLLFCSWRAVLGCKKWWESKEECKKLQFIRLDDFFLYQFIFIFLLYIYQSFAIYYTKERQQRKQVEVVFFVSGIPSR